MKCENGKGMTNLPQLAVSAAFGCANLPLVALTVEFGAFTL
jgi:hypothetical protein